jgi:hypothetical protein
MILIYNLTGSKLKRLKINPYLLFIPFILVIVGVSLVFYKNGYDDGVYYTEKFEKEFSINSSDDFSRANMIKLMKQLNIQFPYIPMAQSILETGFWKSDIFLENHNLFGMKEARARISTASGTNKNHAHYNSWRESIYDYAFYQCRYLPKIQSEDEYFAYLGASYAEDTSYINKVKQIIEREKLREKFN